MFAVMAISLFSCGGDKDIDAAITDEEIAQATPVKISGKGFYYGDSHDIGGKTFYIPLVTEGVIADSYDTTGTGLAISLELIAEEQINVYPKNGVYKIKPAWELGSAVAGYSYDVGKDLFGEAAAGQMGFMPLGSFAVNVKNGVTSPVKYAVDGYVKVEGTIENARMLIKYVYADGTEDMLYLSGELNIADAAPGFDWEPEEAQEFNVVADKAYATFMGKKYKDEYNIVQLLLLNNEWGAYLDLCLPSDYKYGDSFNGTYNFAYIRGEGVVIASKGAETFTVYPSYGYTGIEIDPETGNSYYTKEYYFEKGSVVVSDGSVVLNTTTHFGSKINMTFNGTIEMEDGTQEPPMGMPHKARAGR